MDRFVDVAPGTRLWAEERGAPDAPPLLLIMGAQASGVGWPDELVGLLAARHRVIRYDHRDTGRSTRAFDRQPYPITTLVVSAPAEPVYPPRTPSTSPRRSTAPASSRSPAWATHCLPRCAPRSPPRSSTTAPDADARRPPARIMDAGPPHRRPPGRLTTGRDWRAGMGPTIGERPPGPVGPARVPCAWAVP